jgi:hypothetical protein
MTKKKAEASKLEEVVDNLRNEVLTDELELGTHGFFPISRSIRLTSAVACLCLLLASSTLACNSTTVALKKAEASKLEEVVDNLRNEVLTDELELGTHGFFLRTGVASRLDSELRRGRLRRRQYPSAFVLRAVSWQHELQQIQRQIDEETKKLKGFNDELDSLKEAINAT